MAQVASSDEKTPPGEFLQELDEVLALTAHFQDVFGRVPDAVELQRLSRCREALAWRIAPPRRLPSNSRVIARRSQPATRISPASGAA